jgi:uncharacterized membrane protein YcaP (DUF421 family)
MSILTLLLVLLIGSLIAIPLTRNKYTKVIPSAIVLIIVGIIMGGSTDISNGDQ